MQCVITQILHLELKQDVAKYRKNSGFVRLPAVEIYVRSILKDFEYHEKLFFL